MDFNLAQAIAHNGTKGWAQAIEAAHYSSRIYECRFRVYKSRGLWTIDVAQTSGPWQ